ncbi:MAG TPA: conjugal transfer protein TraG N-terminal domain-containing protein, partial [Rhabdochlamydiaceae bacterium]|nr:conjugal transfer protein TraG N-terminal domain-containing protein [Rhabdochlamydiaceae bacterium]
SSGIDKTFNGILRIVLAVGGFCSICLAFFRSSFEPLFKSFFLTSVAIMCCLLVPRTTVYIQDHLTQKASSPKTVTFTTVDNVPFFLGKIASLVSSISYQLTTLTEKVAHGTNDALYNWTGHIYAGDNIFQTKKCLIADPVLEDNFREFCRECVFRDLGLGIYSKNDLINSSNVLKFLENHTSQIRTIYYRDVPVESSPSSPHGSFIPCREAIKKMNVLFDKTTGNTKDILLGEISDDFKFLLQSKNAGETELRNLIKQQIAINLLKEEIPGTLNSFASKRAEILQKENQKILGALGANSIIAMRNFFEATVYMVFPLIILICLLSFGFKPLINWIHFILWVNSWPPFYVVVKFLLSSIWEFRTRHSFGDSYTLTIFTSEGLSDLYSSMESIAAISMAFIPFLSWILLKGGVSQMVQLASSIMSPAQSAASATAAEKTYGNYSFGNVSLDNTNGYNAQTFRQTYSGLLSAGSFGIDSGTETMTYTPGQNTLYIRQSDSYLREGVSRTQAFSSAIQNSFSTSQSALQEKSKSLSENISDTSNKAVGFVQALSKNFQSGENFNIQNSSGLQEAVQYMQGLGHDYAHAKGVSNDQALREVISAGISGSLGIKGGIDMSYQDGVSKSETSHDTQKTFDSESFQHHLQTLINASHGEIGNILKGEDQRLHEDFSLSYNQSKSASEQWRAAYTTQEALSSLKSFSESDSLSVHQNLNQRFVEFLNDKYQDASKINMILDMPSESLEKQGLIHEFVENLITHNNIDKTNADIEAVYMQQRQEVGSVSEATYYDNAALLSTHGNDKLGYTWGDVEQEVSALKQETIKDFQLKSSDVDKDHSKVDLQYQCRRSSSENSIEKPLSQHFWDEASSLNLVRSTLRSSLTKITSPTFSHGTRAVHQELFGNAPENP